MNWLDRVQAVLDVMVAIAAAVFVISLLVLWFVTVEAVIKIYGG